MSCDLELNQTAQWLYLILILREEQAGATQLLEREGESLVGGGACKQTQITQTEPRLQVQNPKM